MKTTVTGVALVLGLTFAIPAHAQFQPRTPPSGPEGGSYVSISGSGQLQNRTFSSGGTFTSFGETGRFASVQNIGRGGVADVTGGYRVTKHVGLAVGVWMSATDSAAAATVVAPDPLVFGKFTSSTLTSSDLKLRQTSLGLNVQFMYVAPISNRTEMSVFLGPTFMHVKQDVAMVAVAPNAQAGVLSIQTQAANTGKAGNAGIDLTQRMTDRIGIGVFVRYAGGEVTLPAAPNLKVGGAQVGAALRMYF
jgi:hypothetical protein